MDTEKDIKETQEKTFVYMSSVLIGTLIPNVFILINGFFFRLIEYMTYHNNVDDNGGKLLHYVNTKEIPIYMILSLIFTFVFIIFIRFYVKRIQSIEKKRNPLIISISIMVTSTLISGYISIILLNLVISYFS